MDGYKIDVTFIKEQKGFVNKKMEHENKIFPITKNLKIFLI